MGCSLVRVHCSVDPVLRKRDDKHERNMKKEIKNMKRI
jgi:hypothetical protein